MILFKYRGAGVLRPYLVVQKTFCARLCAIFVLCVGKRICQGSFDIAIAIDRDKHGPDPMTVGPLAIVALTGDTNPVCTDAAVVLEREGFKGELEWH